TLPILILGTLDTTVLVGYTHRQSSYLLFFFWIGFGAVLLPRGLALLGTGLVSAASFWVGATTGLRGEAVEILFLVVPSYLAVLFFTRLGVEGLQALQQQRTEARFATARLSALYDFCALLSSEHRIDRLL